MIGHVLRYPFYWVTGPCSNDIASGPRPMLNCLNFDFLGQSQRKFIKQTIRNVGIGSLMILSISKAKFYSSKINLVSKVLLTIVLNWSLNTL